MANTSLEIPPYTIDADGRQWTARKSRTTEKGEPASDILGYYADLDGALRCILRDGIGGLGKTTVTKALAHLDELWARVEAQPARLFEVTIKEVVSG